MDNFTNGVRSFSNRKGIEMRCKSCGTSIGKGVKFCPNCGTPSGKASEASEKKGTGCFNKFIFFVMICFVILFIHAFYQVEVKKDKDPSRRVTVKKAESVEKKPEITKEPHDIIADDVMEIGGFIKEVKVVAQESGYVVSVFIDPKTIWSEKTYFVLVGNTMVNSAQLLAEKHPNDVKEIVYFLRGPTVDKYGKESSGLFMKLWFPMTELKKINWKNMYYDRFLNFASNGTFKPIGRRILNQYCLEQDDGTAREFCLRFLK